jgi:hypothetical protein
LQDFNVKVTLAKCKLLETPKNDKTPQRKGGEAQKHMSLFQQYHRPYANKLSICKQRIKIDTA